MGEKARLPHWKACEAIREHDMEEEAKRHRVKEAYHITSFEELCAAVAMGFLIMEKPRKHHRGLVDEAWDLAKMMELKRRKNQAIMEKDHEQGQ